MPTTLVRSLNALVLEKRRPSVKRLKQHHAQTIKSVALGSGVLRVMVVDDDRDTVDSMGMLVELWGYDVAKAYDGTTALALASTYRPHVLLVDIAMPTMNGCRLGSQLRQLPCLQNALLVAVTGCTGEEQRKSCKEAGFDYLFLKPVSTNIIEHLLFNEQEQLAKPAVTWNSLAIQDNNLLLRSEWQSMVSNCVGASCFR